MERSNPEDWSTNDYTSRSALYCGVNVLDETGKMSRSDKRGATLPKVATARKGSRKDKFVYTPRETTLLGDSSPKAQNDTFINKCHVEVYRRIARKGKTRGL